MVEIEHLIPIPANENPYAHDLFRMGCGAGNKQPEDQETYRGDFFSIMWGLENNKIVIIYNPTGERIELTFSELREEMTKIIKGGLRNQTSFPGKLYQELME